MRLTVSHLSKSFGGVPVLRDVSFTAGPEPVCVMGPSGEGKTTLVRILLGLERADSGFVSGLENARASAVFQEDRLLPGRTALENLRFVLGKAYDEPAARRLLEELGLADAADRPVREFSGGMRRRTALARALIVPFDFLALDEPFTGLDKDSRRQCLNAVQARTAGKTVLLVSHDESDAGVLGARIVRLSKGTSDTH